LIDTINSLVKGLETTIVLQQAPNNRAELPSSACGLSHSYFRAARDLRPLASREFGARMRQESMEPRSYDEDFVGFIVDARHRNQAAIWLVERSLSSNLEHLSPGPSPVRATATLR
jgi:hypothetical protein